MSSSLSLVFQRIIESMKRKKLSLLLSLVACASLLLLGYVIYAFPPSSVITIPFVSLEIPSLYAFFICFILFTFSFISLIFKTIKRGIIISSLLTCYLVLRISGFTNFYFAIILIAIYITLELFMRKK